MKVKNKSTNKLLKLQEELIECIYKLQVYSIRDLLLLNQIEIELTNRRCILIRNFR